MKKYILTQLTQVSSWIGVLIIVMALIVPRQYIVFLGIALILVDDAALKAWIAKQSPWLAAKINEWTA